MKSFKQDVVCHQAFIVKRELAELHDLTYRFSSDFDWAIRLMKKTNAICNSHLLLIDYPNEAHHHQPAGLLKERYRIMAKHYGHLYLPPPPVVRGEGSNREIEISTYTSNNMHQRKSKLEVPTCGIEN